ncbi:MAG TPA: amidohydrolase [Clostridiales bacterium]|jgi:amidohydrolase|nr:amidohydrolase [Clostridiales bacterium]
MNKVTLQKAIAFRHELHQHPFLSNEERPTLERIIRFLKEHTKNIEVVDKGHYVYAIYRAKDAKKPAMAFRSDNDAIKVYDDIDKPYKSVTDGVAHKCGHDGHTATMAAFALEIDQSGADRDVYFLFQPAEENGSGAAQCLDFITDNQIPEIYGFHNEPGQPKFTVLVRDGLLCCASKGMIITMTGAPSHASEPENGKNPSFAIAKTALASERIAAPENYKGLVLATIVQIDVGEKEAFGVAASKGKLLMTIRGEYENEMNDLQSKLEEEALKNAKEYGLQCEFSYCDAFPETISHPESNEKIRKAAAELELPVYEIPTALRGSEDFGHFTKLAKGAMFFMSYGEGKPMIHTSKYDFDDDLIEPVVEMYRKLLAY